MRGQSQLIERGTAVQQPGDLEAWNGLPGNWKLKAKISMPDGSILAGMGKAESKSVLRGQGIHIKLKASVYETGELEKRGLEDCCVDGNEQGYVFRLMSVGTIYKHIGNWKGDKTFEVEWKNLKEGEKTIERNLSFTWVSPKELYIRQEDTLEGQLGLTAEYILKK